MFFQVSSSWLENRSIKLVTNASIMSAFLYPSAPDFCEELKSASLLESASRTLQMTAEKNGLCNRSTAAEFSLALAASDEITLASEIKNEEGLLRLYQGMVRDSEARLHALREKDRKLKESANYKNARELKIIQEERAARYMACAVYSQMEADLKRREEEDAALALQLAQEDEAENQLREQADAVYAQELRRIYSGEDRQRRETEKAAEEVALEQLRIKDKAEREALVAERLYECRICLDEVTIENIYIIDNCEHKYCSRCLKIHAKTTIDSGTPDVKCPCPECRELLDIQSIRQLLSLEPSADSQTDLLRLEELFQERYMQHDPLYVRCPNVLEVRGTKVPCNMWGMRDAVGRQQATCLKCTFRFCGNCGNRAHTETCEAFAPIAAAERGDVGAAEALLRQWRATSHSKVCPGCSVLVERSDGCNHMTCRCKHQFCYRCGKTMPGGRFECGCPQFG